LSSLPIDPNFRNKDQAFNVAEHAHRELKKKRKEKKRKRNIRFSVRLGLTGNNPSAETERNNNKLLNENLLFSLAWGSIWRGKKGFQCSSLQQRRVAARLYLFCPFC
jgi:hypothetical protein